MAVFYLVLFLSLKISIQRFPFICEWTRYDFRSINPKILVFAMGQWQVTVQVNLCQKLFFFENMLCTEIVLNVKNNFCTQHVLPMF